MASIRLRNGKWQARVIRKGHPSTAKSFITKQDAERWSRGVEIEMDRGSYTSTSTADQTTLAQVIARFCAEVTPHMRSARDDLIRLTALQRHPLCVNFMSSLTPAKIAAFRDQRLGNVGPGTVIRELAYLSSIINHARREWGITCANPVSLVRKPPTPQGRQRVLDDAEEVRLFDALDPIGRRSPWMLPLVRLALATAMRRGELLGLCWEHVDIENKTAVLNMTKNGDRRAVPLSSVARSVLSSLPTLLAGPVFPISSYAAAAAFDKATSRAGLTDFRFHDLRHTAITRMAEKLPNVIELAAVTGHRSLKMLQGYYHPSPINLALKLG